MQQLLLKYNLPFVQIIAKYQSRQIIIPSVLVDTGSGSTILSADLLFDIGIWPEPNDTIHTIRGVGGTEVVFKRKLSFLKLDDIVLDNFEIEVGAVDYGFEINGILGMDFLTKAGVLIDLKNLQIAL